jgi:hypothetical protein
MTIDCPAPAAAALDPGPVRPVVELGRLEEFRESLRSRHDHVRAFRGPAVVALAGESPSASHPR